MGETSTTSLSMRCFTLKRVLGQCAAPAPHPSPSSMAAMFAHYFFMGWFSVSQSNLLAQESQTPGE